MGRKDTPPPQKTRKADKIAVRSALKDAKDTPSGALGISTDDAAEAIQRGKAGGK